MGSLPRYFRGILLDILPCNVEHYKDNTPAYSMMAFMRVSIVKRIWFLEVADGKLCRTYFE
jgi:hypothetical protein